MDLHTAALSAEDLLTRARAGDADAFAGIVVELGPDVLRLCTIITASPWLAEDAAQNAWRQAWRKLDTLRDDANLRRWLLRVAANEAKQLVRRDRRHYDQSLDSAHHVPMPSVAQDWELRDVLVSLKPADRELLAYRYVLGFRSDEIGQHLGLSAAGIRSRLKRIRDRLKKELAKNE